MWTVTRQSQWPEGTLCVEISRGDINYSNPGMLVGSYPGEGAEFNDPREAVQTAIEIAQAWQKDCPKEKIGIAHGATGGYTMPFEGEELTEETFKGLREWAEKEWEELPKCDHCGGLVGKQFYTSPDHGDDFKFCREYCVEEWMRGEHEFSVTCSIQNMTDEQVRAVLSEHEWEFDETDTPEALQDILIKEVLSGEIEESVIY
jgi:hypothetical protein